MTAQLVSSPAPTDEERRMVVVRHHGILDTPPEAAFDRVVLLAAQLLEVPMATVSILDGHRIWFKAAHGMGGMTETAHHPGLCATRVVADTLLDPATAGISLVTGPTGVRFHAAAAITTADGHHLGAVTALDTRPRAITADDAATLADLAAIVVDELDLRLSLMGDRGALSRARAGDR